jgi:hypothetical protein
MREKTDFEKLGNFINGIGAARALLQRSYKEEFLIEALVLYAALIDGFCRISLVLKQQIDKKASDFDAKYIHQKNDQGYLSERDIYKAAFERSILDQELLDEVNALYDFRNKIIHRFLISEIEYSHLGLVLDRYELLYQRLRNIVHGLESEQIHKGIGMTVLKKTSKDDKQVAHRDILNKIDSKDTEKLKQILGSKLIHDKTKFSIKMEREKISDDVSDELEEYEERSKIPPGFTSVKAVTNWAKRKGLFENCTCDHLKINHVEMSKKKSGNIADHIKHCKADGCRCTKYILAEN